MPAASQLSPVRELPMQLRASMLEPATFDQAENTVEVVWTTGARVRRMDYWTGLPYEEELAVDPEAVDMGRFEAGAVQVLDGHRQYGGMRAIVGVVVKAWLTNGEGRALIKLSQRAEVADLVTDIRAGIIRNVSVGYSVQRYSVTRAADRTDGVAVDLWVADKWQPAELSFVPVNADMEAGTRSIDTVHQRSHARTPCEFAYINRQQEATMPGNTSPNPVPANQAGAEQIRALVKRHGLPDEFAGELVARGLTMEDASLQILERMAANDRAAGGHLNVSRVAQGTGYVPPDTRGVDMADRVEAMADELAARHVGRRGDDKGNPYRHARVPDMAREILELRGINTASMSAAQIIERALHTTSDFPNLLQGTGQRVLRAAYQAAPAGVRMVARQTTARDFRAKQRLQLGEAPTLLQVNEHGEFKSGTMAEAKESYALSTFGRIFGISRQALVNDDLDAFGDMSVKLGRAAAEFESKFLADLLISNPTLANDSLAVFHATHGNLGTGAGSALSETSLSAARTAMRLMKGLDGSTPINAEPAYLIVPAALETTGQKLLAAIQPAKSSDVNPFAQTLQLVVEPRLDATSAVAWYLAASSAVIDTIEYAYLEGEEGPQIFTREGFEIDGLEFKVREDFGGAILDFRGLYKANGA